jgi:hypothetical protein
MHPLHKATQRRVRYLTWGNTKKKKFPLWLRPLNYTEVYPLRGAGSFWRSRYVFTCSRGLLSLWYLEFVCIWRKACSCTRGFWVVTSCSAVVGCHFTQKMEAASPAHLLYPTTALRGVTTRKTSAWILILRKLVIVAYTVPNSTLARLIPSTSRFLKTPFPIQCLCSVFSISHVTSFDIPVDIKWKIQSMNFLLSLFDRTCVSKLCQDNILALDTHRSAVAISVDEAAGWVIGSWQPLLRSRN